MPPASCVIWSTGYGFDLGGSTCRSSMRRRAAAQKRRRRVPGLYFIGLQWLSKMSSSFMSGVGADAARLADHITRAVLLSFLQHVLDHRASEAVKANFTQRPRASTLVHPHVA